MRPHRPAVIVRYDGRRAAALPALAYEFDRKRRHHVHDRVREDFLDFRASGADQRALGEYPYRWHGSHDKLIGHKTRRERATRRRPVGTADFTGATRLLDRTR